RSVKIWDVESSTALFALRGHSNMVMSVAFSPDGARLASSSLDGTVKVWDATTAPEAQIFSGPTGQIRSVALSPDGNRIACSTGTWAGTQEGYVDPELKVWDAHTGRELVKIELNSAVV